MKKVGRIHYLKDLNSVCNFNETPEMKEDLGEEEEFLELNKIVIKTIDIDNDDDDGDNAKDDDGDNNADGNDDDDQDDETSLNVNSVFDQVIDNYNNKNNSNNLLSKLLTKEGKNIAIALGETATNHEKQIIILDKCKISLKKNPGNNEKYNDYINSLVPLQSLVLKRVSDVEKKISAWEKEFWLQNNLAIPTQDDWEEETKYLMEQLKYGKFLLRML